MKKVILLLLISCLALTVSCKATQPKLKFFKLDENYRTEDTADKFFFRMPKPIIEVTAADDKDKFKPVFTATVAPRDGMFAVKADDPWYVDATHTISYQQDSFLLKSFSVETTDNRIKYIEQVGAIAAAAIPILVSLGPPEEPTQVLRANLPYRVDVVKCFDKSLDAVPPAGLPAMVACEEQIIRRMARRPRAGR